MSSLDDLAKNAIPPKTDSDTQPVTYVPPNSKKIPVDPTAIPKTQSTTEQMKSENKKIIDDPSSLGDPPPPPPPNIYEHWMNDLDAALQRDRERMWNTIEAAKQKIDLFFSFIFIYRVISKEVILWSMIDLITRFIDFL